MRLGRSDSVVPSLGDEPKNLVDFVLRVQSGLPVVPITVPGGGDNVVVLGGTHPISLAA